MSIFNFIDPEVLDDILERADGDNRFAFMELANIATRRLSEKESEYDDTDEREWYVIEELRYSCRNVILALGKRLEIEPFASMEVPPYNGKATIDWKAFQFDLDHYITQIALDNSIRNRSNGVVILPKSKEQIRGYVHRLRECIEQGNMDDKKREALLKKLDQLEHELEKRRVSMLAIAQVAYHLWAVPGASYSSYEIANKLITNVMVAVATAKADEEAAKQLAAPEPIRALSAPRTEQPKQSSWGNNDLDDEVPF